MANREQIRRKIKWSLLIFVVVIIAGYGFFQARHLATGPVITIAYPANGTVATSSLITISGHAENIAYMTLDGAPLYTDSDGDWSEDKVLLPGYNVITIVGSDTFGKTKTETLQITYSK